MISLRPWTGSIVARMTAWYAGSALVLILAATGFLYWVLATSFDAEDRRTLANTVTDLRLLLRASGELRLPEAATPVPSHSLRQPQEIWVRIVDAEGRTLLESPGMDGELPVAVFPPPAQVEAGQDVNGEVATVSGRLFQVLSARALADPGHPDGRVLQVAWTARPRNCCWCTTANGCGSCSSSRSCYARPWATSSPGAACGRSSA